MGRSDRPDLVDKAFGIERRLTEHHERREVIGDDPTRTAGRREDGDLAKSAGDLRRAAVSGNGLGRVLG